MTGETPEVRSDKREEIEERVVPDIPDICHEHHGRTGGARVKKFIQV